QGAMTAPRKSARPHRAAATRVAITRDVSGDISVDVSGAGADGAASDAESHTALAAVHDTYRLLDDHFDEIYAACQTDDARAQLRALHASARDAYWKAVADGLHDDNLVVQDIRRDLTAATTRIQAQLATLEDVTAVLDMLTQAVRLAGALVGLAAMR
nr:hypothetical protein [Candidatus Eremiobacteraeota bacterium]